MLQKIYWFLVQGYEYFGGQYCDRHEYENAKEALEAWNKHKEKDYHYIDDGYRFTSDIKVKYTYSIDKQERHGKVYGHKPTRFEQYLDKADECDILSAEHDYWFNRAMDVYRRNNAIEVEFPVYGWDGVQVDTFACVPNGELCKWFCKNQGFIFDGEKFITDNSIPMQMLQKAFANAVC